VDKQTLSPTEPSNIPLNQDRPPKLHADTDPKSLEIKAYPYFENLKAARKKATKHKTKDLTEYIIDRCLCIGEPVPTVAQASHLASDAIEYDFSSFDENKAHTALLKFNMERKDALERFKTFEESLQAGAIPPTWKYTRPYTAENKIDWELRMIRENISRNDVELAVSLAGEYKLSIKQIKKAAAIREWNRANKAKTIAEERLARKGIDLKSLGVILSNYQGYITMKKQEEEEQDTETAAPIEYCYYVPFSNEDMEEPNPPLEEIRLEELTETFEDQEDT